MYIGAGTYVDDFENKLKQRVLKKNKFIEI
jgi:hypothetical protein